MQWIIAIELLAIIIILLGLVGTMNDFIKAAKPKASIDDGSEPEFFADQIPMTRPRNKKPSPSKGLKRAVKQTTTLRKKA